MDENKINKAKAILNEYELTLSDLANYYNKLYSTYNSIVFYTIGIFTFVCVLFVSNKPYSILLFFFMMSLTFFTLKLCKFLYTKLLNPFSQKNELNSYYVIYNSIKNKRFHKFLNSAQSYKLQRMNKK